MIADYYVCETVWSVAFGFPATVLNWHALFYMTYHGFWY